MSAKKLAIVTNAFPAHDPKGLAATVARYVAICRALGLTAEVVTFDPARDGHGWETEVGADGVPVTRVRGQSLLPLRRMIWQSLQARGPFDGLIVFGPGNFGQPALMCARDWGVPLIAHVTAVEMLVGIHDPIWAPFLSWVLAEASVVATPLAALAALVPPFRPNGEVALWPESVDPRPFRPRTIRAGSSGTVRIGTMPALSEENGLLETVAAFSLVVRQCPGAELVLTGNVAERLPPPWFESWRQRDPQAAARLVMRPEPAAGGWPDELATWDQAWLPWRIDGQGNDLLLVLAAGLPLVATTAGSNGAYLRQGDNALLVPIGEPESLARAALSLAQDPARAQAMGDRARASLPTSSTPEAEREALAHTFRELGWL